ncbi:DinB family protein [Pedobacter sp. ASV1-7]|uniref:DinB family protein n=1 Tax=Pedobacter sp. ASV1-7 TaxID=3145237 RepID=UPI0032E850EC
MLSVLIQEHLETVNQFIEMPEEILSKRPVTGGWTAFECIEHLNIYGRYYLPKVKSGLSSAPDKEDSMYKSGLMGNYFVNIMRPFPHGKKMSTLKKTDPKFQVLDISAVQEFRNQLLELQELIQISGGKDLRSKKIPMSIFPILKLQIGDILQMVIYHNGRHLDQAQRVLSIEK